jgi:hypothetical protein
MTIPADPMPDDSAEEAALKRALRLIADNREGKVAFEEHVVPMTFIRAPKSGHLLASVPVALLMADEIVLYVPDETDDALQLLLTAEQVEESSLTDRHAAYFPEPDHVRWAELYIDAGRLNEYVFDGDALMTPNPLAPCEVSLIKALNADRDALRAATAARANREVTEPVAVGVDPLGADIRARFGIVRLPFESESPDEASARAQITSLLKAGG